MRFLRDDAERALDAADAGGTCSLLPRFEYVVYNDMLVRRKYRLQDYKKGLSSRARRSAGGYMYTGKGRNIKRRTCPKRGLIDWKKSDLPGRDRDTKLDLAVGYEPEII